MRRWVTWITLVCFVMTQTAAVAGPRAGEPRRAVRRLAGVGRVGRRLEPLRADVARAVAGRRPARALRLAVPERKQGLRDGLAAAALPAARRAAPGSYLCPFREAARLRKSFRSPGGRRDPLPGRHGRYRMRLRRVGLLHGAPHHGAAPRARKKGKAGDARRAARGRAAADAAQGCMYAASFIHIERKAR